MTKDDPTDAVAVALTADEIETLLLAITDARAEKMSESDDARVLDVLAEKIRAQLPEGLR